MADILFKLTKTKASAREILESGKAYEKMKQIIKAQGGKSKIKPSDLKLGKYQTKIKANISGKIKEINNKTITKIARIAGAPSDKEAGIYLSKKIGDKLKKDETIFTIYANSKEKLNYAKTFSKQVITIN